MQFTFSITQQHISEGIATGRNPIEVSLVRQAKDVSITIDTISLNGQTYPWPEKLAHFNLDFQWGYPIKPSQFTLDNDLALSEQYSQVHCTIPEWGKESQYA